MLKYINVRMKKLKNEITKFLHYLNFKLFLSYSIANYIYLFGSRLGACDGDGEHYM